MGRRNDGGAEAQMSTFTIQHDTRRYGDETGGLKAFGARIVVSGVTAEQAEEIAAALSGWCDAGLTDLYEVQTTENNTALAIAREELRFAPDGSVVHDPATCWHCLNPLSSGASCVG